MNSVPDGALSELELYSRPSNSNSISSRLVKSALGAKVNSSVIKVPKSFLRTCRSLVSRLWLWEALAIFLMLSSLITIVSILLKYDGEPLPTLPFRIEVNSLISVFTALLKGSMLLVLAESK